MAKDAAPILRVRPYPQPDIEPTVLNPLVEEKYQEAKRALSACSNLQEALLARSMRREKGGEGTVTIDSVFAEAENYDPTAHGYTDYSFEQAFLHNNHNYRLEIHVPGRASRIVITEIFDETANEHTWIYNTRKSPVVDNGLAFYDRHVVEETNPPTYGLIAKDSREAMERNDQLVGRLAA